MLNAEIGKAAGVGFFLDRNIFDSGGGRADMAPGEHFIHVFFFAFKNCFHAAILHISYPAGKVKTHCRALGFRTEKNSLYPAAYMNMNTLHEVFLPMSFKNSFSLIILIPEDFALSSLEPGSSPVTT